jgi:sorbitol-specific phosphotransferase system component IIC
MIDQYLSTSGNVRLRQFSTVKIARRLVSLTFFFSILHSLLLIIYNQINVSKTTNITSCSLSNSLVYRSYIAYFVTPFLLGIIPTFIMIIFAVLAYANINYLHQEQMRTQIQQQLTRMVSAQALFVLLGMIAYSTQTIYTLLTMSMPKNTFQQAQENVGLTISGVLNYTGYTFNFYIYMTVSPSLRKQFKQLIRKYLRYLICHNRCTIVTNRTAPLHGTRNTFQPHLIRPQKLVPVEQ